MIAVASPRPPMNERARGGGYRSGLAILATIFFMWGFITVLNDVLVPHLKSVFLLDHEQALLIQFFFFSTYFIMALPGAKLIEWLGYKYAIASGLAVTGAGALGFIPAATLASYPMFLLALFVLASGITTLQVAANPYVAIIGPAASAPSRLNLVQAFNSMGTAVAPYFGGLLILGQSKSGTTLGAATLTQAQRMSDALAVRWPYAGIALILFLLALVISLWPLPQISASKAPDEHGSGSLWSHKRLIFGVAAIFLYVGAEISVGSFLIGYIADPRVGNMTTADAAFYVSLFWSGAMIGRFVGSAAMRAIPASYILALLSIGAAGLIGLSILTSGTVALWAIVGVGLMNSIMFPTIFTLAIEGLGHLTQRGSGLLIMAIVGGALVPLLQAYVADHSSVRIAFLIPAACYLYVLWFARSCRTPQQAIAAS